MPQETSKYFTNNAKQTQKLGSNFAKESLLRTPRNGALVFGLSGDLGSGKTTFLQGFAKGLGVKEKVLSPTFVIMKKFPISEKGLFENFYHIDCYRLLGEKDLGELGFNEIISNPKNIVAIEWPEVIGGAMPSGAEIIRLEFIDQSSREISFYLKEAK